jgi:hypothetical protein
MSVASGPKLRRYEDVSWDDDSWSRTSTMTGLSTKVKDVVKTKCGIKDKDPHAHGHGHGLNADALHHQLSTLTPSASGISSFTSTSDGSSSSAQLQTVTSRHFFDSASAVSIALSSTSNSSSDSSNNTIETPRKTTPTLLDAFDQTPSVPERKFGGQQWPQFLSGNGNGHEHGHGNETRHVDNRTTPKATSRNYRPTISQPFSFAVLSTPMSADPQNMQLPSGGRPVIASASPNFSLISLAHAQQKERERSRTPHGGTRIRAVAEPMPMPVSTPTPMPVPIPVPASPQSHRLKNKKSGIMKFLNKTPKTKRSQDRKEPYSPDTGYRTMEYTHAYDEIVQSQHHDTTTTAVEVEAKDSIPQPMLSLRPVSMNISRHLPDQYFALTSPKASPSLATLSESAHIDDFETQRKATTEAETRLANAKKAHQLQVYELEAQVRELKLTLEAAASGQTTCAVCENCGHERGSKPASGIMNRARVKTAGPRGVFGTGSLYEAM